jgi:periplasmic divalent cation tolerance protein
MAILIVSTAPDRRTAQRLASLLLQRRLAACVSFKEGFISTYRWKGKIEKSGETLLLIKTVRKNFIKIKKLMDEFHPYEVPELLSFRIEQGSADYLKWLTAELRS